MLQLDVSAVLSALKATWRLSWATLSRPSVNRQCAVFPGAQGMEVRTDE